MIMNGKDVRGGRIQYTKHGIVKYSHICRNKCVYLHCVAQDLYTAETVKTIW